MTMHSSAQTPPQYLLLRCLARGVRARQAALAAASSAWVGQEQLLLCQQLHQQAGTMVVAMAAAATPAAVRAALQLHQQVGPGTFHPLSR
jgi:hypothetical protein